MAARSRGAVRIRGGRPTGLGPLEVECPILRGLMTWKRLFSAKNGRGRASSARSLVGDARPIIERCKRELQTAGFTSSKGAVLWRRTNIKFDILKFDVVPAARCAKWRVPAGSFGLDASCLFPTLPLLGQKQPNEAHRPEQGFGQVRLLAYRGTSQPEVSPPNLWWADPQAFEAIAKDVLGTITDKILPFFGRFEDPAEVLRTLVEDDDAIGQEGVWDFGKRGSPKRLLYTGFAAMECGEWDLAISSLRACRNKTLAIPKPVGEQVQAEILPYVDQGLSSAERKHAWTAGSDALLTVGALSRSRKS